MQTRKKTKAELAMKAGVDGNVVNRISVPDDDKFWAGRALNRMMSLA